MKQIDPVKLPTTYDISGNTYTKKDILAMNIVRWSKGKKYLIINAISHGVLTREEVLKLFHIESAELDSWIQGFNKQGTTGLQMRTIANNVRTRSGD